MHPLTLHVATNLECPLVSKVEMSLAARHGDERPIWRLVGVASLIGRGLGSIISSLKVCCVMTPPATRDSWKIRECPAQREPLELSLLLTDADGERLQLGHIPADMDDKWFIFFERGWLYFHRSWTGDCIFGVKFDGSPKGVRAVEAWASRDHERYRSPGIEREKQLVIDLIRSRLLAH